MKMKTLICGSVCAIAIAVYAGVTTGPLNPASGGALTGLNASQLTIGTLPAAVLPGNLAALQTNSTVYGAINGVDHIINTFGVVVFVNVSGVAGTSLTNFDGAGNPWLTNFIGTSPTNFQTFVQPNGYINASTATGTIFIYHGFP